MLDEKSIELLKTLLPDDDKVLTTQWVKPQENVNDERVKNVQATFRIRYLHHYRIDCDVVPRT
jgi:hypothetical protein